MYFNPFVDSLGPTAKNRQTSNLATCSLRRNRQVMQICCKFRIIIFNVKLRLYYNKQTHDIYYIIIDVMQSDIFKYTRH